MEAGFGVIVTSGPAPVGSSHAQPWQMQLQLFPCVDDVDVTRVVEADGWHYPAIDAFDLPSDFVSKSFTHIFGKPFSCNDRHFLDGVHLVTALWNYQNDSSEFANSRSREGAETRPTDASIDRHEAH